ncbi:hypothetical protein PsYK624_151550 [Phanerochaete sordida]|uniref:Uncharacterized protein n=1 Tax=Phanerochaete sordida TaxID=48140 RepID=A0A9P3GPW6_9APHY|nr:hypothetical protein PsYK624_151550 [Phanerochaete sordida]
MFTYDKPGQNLDIRGVIRYGPAANASALQDMDTVQLVPAVVASAPNATRQYPLTIVLELADSQLFLGS